MPKEETIQPPVNVAFTPEQLTEFFTQKGTKKKEKAVKHTDKDHIGMPFQPIVGTGEGLEDYEQWLVEMQMASRPSTNPERHGHEGYPSALNVIRYIRPTKSTQVAIDIENQNVCGCSMAAPGNPNHLCIWLPKGVAKPGLVIPSDMKWVNGSKTVVLKLDQTKMMYQL